MMSLEQSSGPVAIMTDGATESALISTLLTHAERHHGEQEIVSRRAEGDAHRLPFANWQRLLAVRQFVGMHHVRLIGRGLQRIFICFHVGCKKCGPPSSDIDLTFSLPFIQPI